MDICEFCHTQYHSRPQVKKPRACPRCQKRRQQANEKAWKQRNLGLYDGEYHRAQREVRLRKLRLKIEAWIRCMEVGGTFLGVAAFAATMRDELVSTLLKLIAGLGFRRANKFWPIEIPNQMAGF